MSWGDPGRVDLSWDWETVFGTDPSVPSAWSLPIDSEDFKVEDAPIETDTLGDGNPSEPSFATKGASGSLTVPLDLDAIGFHLKGMLGAPTTTGSASPYTHIFKYVATTPLPSAVIDRGHPDLTLYYKYNGCMYNTMGISIAGRGPLQVSLGLLCKGETKGTSAYHATPTGNLSHTYTKLHLPDVSAMTEGGGAVTNVEEFNLNIDNRLDSSFGLAGAGARTRCIRTKMRINGNILATFEDDSLLLKARNHTETSLVIALTSGSYSLSLQLEELKYAQTGPGTRGPAGLRINLPFTAYFKDGSNAAAVKATLVNTKAAVVYA